MEEEDNKPEELENIENATEEDISPPPETNTLLIEDSPALRKLLGQNLEVYTGTRVDYVYDADKTIDYLKRNKDIQLIICKDKIGEENTSLKIVYYVKSQKLNIPIILIGENLKLSEDADMVDARDWRKIIKLAAKHLNVTAKQMAYQEMDEYYPISCKALLAMSTTPVDIFINNSETYDLIYEMDGPIDSGQIRQMFLSGDEALYVKSTDRLAITVAFSDQIQGTLSKELSNEDRVSATALSFETAKSLINQSGLSSEAIELSKASVNSMSAMASGSDGLADLLEIIQSSDESYLYKHSMLISLIGCHTIGKMEWGNQEQKDKMAFIAFFHDITLSEDKLCQIHSAVELEKADLTPEEKKEVENHALKACELLKEYPGIPFGADSLILEHHGAGNGIGFAKNTQDNRGSPLAIVFRVVEDYVSELMKPLPDEQSKFDGASVVNDLKIKYTTGAYKKALEALEKAINGA